MQGVTTTPLPTRPTMQRSTSKLLLAALALPLWLCSCPGSGGSGNSSTSGPSGSGGTATFPADRPYNYYRGSFKAYDAATHVTFSVDTQFDAVAGTHGGEYNATSQAFEDMRLRYVAYSKGSTLYAGDAEVVVDANGQPQAPYFNTVWDFGEDVFTLRMDYDHDSEDKHVVAQTQTGRWHFAITLHGTFGPMMFPGQPRFALEMPAFDGWLSVDDVDLLHVRSDMSSTLIAQGGDIRPFGQGMDGNAFVGIDGELLLVDVMTDTYQTIHNMIEMNAVTWDAADDEAIFGVADFAADSLDLFAAGTDGSTSFIAALDDVDAQHEVELMAKGDRVFFMYDTILGERRLGSVKKDGTENVTLLTGGAVPLFFDEIEIAANFLFLDNGDVFGAPEAMAIATNGTGVVTYPGSLWAGGIFGDTVLPCGEPDLKSMVLMGEPGNTAVPSPLGLVDSDNPAAIVRTIGTVPVGIADVQIPRQYGPSVMATGRDTLGTNEIDMFMISADMADAAADEVHRVTETPQGEFPLFTGF